MSAPAPLSLFRAEQSVRPGTEPDPVLRAVAVLALSGIAMIHFLDIFSKFRETPYLGVAYLGLIAASLATAAALVRAEARPPWLIAALLAGATMVGYIASRSVGLPAATDDIGNWTDPLGLASLFVEGLVVVIGVYGALIRRAPASKRVR